eukprot:4440949-Amphidinium_carterae.2
MRGLLLMLPRFSQGGHLNLLFSRGRELYPRPGFRAFSKLRPNQKPEVTHSLSHSLPLESHHV